MNQLKKDQKYFNSEKEIVLIKDILSLLNN